MDAVLIIEDQLKMVHILQEYLKTLNKHITKKNVFCFSDEVRIKSLEEVSCDKNENKRISFEGEEEQVINEVLAFLRSHNDSQVFVMLDFLLISLDPSMPTAGKYKRDGEYSHKIYLELLKAMYKKNIKVIKDKLESSSLDSAGSKEFKRIEKDLKRYEGISPDFDFLLYSRSDIACSLMSFLLEEQYKYGAFDGLDSSHYTYSSIFWVKNRCEKTDENGNPRAEDPPLDLKKYHKEYIKKDLFKGGAGSGKTQ